LTFAIENFNLPLLIRYVGELLVCLLMGQRRRISNYKLSSYLFVLKM